jgi:hypothetical protein
MQASESVREDAQGEQDSVEGSIAWLPPSGQYISRMVPRPEPERHQVARASADAIQATTAVLAAWRGAAGDETITCHGLPV